MHSSGRMFVLEPLVWVSFWLYPHPGGQKQERAPDPPPHRSGRRDAHGRAGTEFPRLCSPMGKANSTWGPRSIIFTARSLLPRSTGKRRPIFGADFVLHSLRHTMLTRLGESGVDAFTIMRIAGHSSVVVSQRYVTPLLRRLNGLLSGCSFTGAGGEASGGVPTILPTVGKAVAVSH